MLMRRVSSKDKIPDGLLRAAVASGAAVALATASLGALGTATASCINFSGIAIGGGGASGACQAAFGSIAIVIGPTPVNEDGEFTGGSTANAGNPSEFSFGNIAVSVGGTEEQPTSTSAGQFTSTGLPLIGNVAIATAGSSARSDGLFNLGASLGGTRSSLVASGVGNSALNLGSDNDLFATGVVNNATNLSGNENFVAAGNREGLVGLNVGFNILGDNNTVLSGSGAPPPFPPLDGNGPLAIAGAILVNNQNLATGREVKNNNFGIELRTPFNEQGPTPPSVLAAGNLFRPTTFAGGSFNRSGNTSGSGSLTNAATQFSSSLNKISSSLSKTLSETVNSVTRGLTGGLTGGTKASDSTNEE